MAYLRQLSSHFDPVYLKPSNLQRVVQQWRTSPAPAYTPDEQQRPPRRQQDRRCGIERRSRQLPTLLDTRSPHARRKQNSRRLADGTFSLEGAGAGVGIDVYV
jgi:hypothetical protein